LWEHEGTTAFNIPTLVINGGTFRFGSKGGTLTTVVLNGGVLDLDAGVGHPHTITNLFQNGGKLIRRGRGKSVTIANDYRSGGERDE
jgi:hypothetical protein